MPMAGSFQARPQVIDFAYDNPRTRVPVIEGLLGWWSEDCWQSNWAFLSESVRVVAHCSPSLTGFKTTVAAPSLAQQLFRQAVELRRTFGVVVL
jgi:hypothetical protein